jgi:AraC-like DNA-binding protein
MRSPGDRPSRVLPSATGGIARLAYRRAEAAGISLKANLKKAGLTEAQITNPHVRLKVRDQIEFLNLAADALNDDFLGFHLAQIPDLREIGLLYYVLASSNTLIEALQRAARYSAIVNDGIYQECLDGKRVGIVLRYVGVSRRTDRHQIEFWMTIIVRLCRKLTQRMIVPCKTQFVHNRNYFKPELSKYLGRKIRFGAPVDEIVFDREVRNLAVVGADPYLNKLLLRYCEEALSHRSPTATTFRSRVEKAIASLLPHGTARAARVAQELGASQRTLARRLRTEQLTFSMVLDDMRHALANRHLVDARLTISQIAWLLGYKEVAAFSHAFKRWTGMTPREARNLMVSAPTSR